MKQRRFHFTYAATINHLAAGESASVWLPVAQSSAEQTVTLKHVRVPGKYRITTEKQFGNRLIYFEATANEQGEIPVEVEYLIERREFAIVVVAEGAFPVGGKPLFQQTGHGQERLGGMALGTGAVSFFLSLVEDRVVDPLASLWPS